MLQPRPTWKQNKEHSLQAYYFQAYIGTWNETSLTYLNKGTKCYGILRLTEFTSNWKNWAGMRGWKINTGKYYKAKREIAHHFHWLFGEWVHRIRQTVSVYDTLYRALSSKTGYILVCPTVPPHMSLGYHC